MIGVWVLLPAELVDVDVLIRSAVTDIRLVGCSIGRLLTVQHQSIPVNKDDGPGVLISTAPTVVKHQLIVLTKLLVSFCMYETEVAKHCSSGECQG